MYLVVKDTGALQALTGTGLFISKRNAYAICEEMNARNKDNNIVYVVRSIGKEWRRVWKKRKAEARRARRVRRFNRLVAKRDTITKKIKKMQKGA